MQLPTLYLKKNEDRRIRAGHLWVYSNEIDTQKSPLKNILPGQEVLITAHDKTPLGVGYANPHSLIVARIISRKLSSRLTTDFFIHKLTNALSLRSRLFPKPYYRLVFGESDGLPGLIIDRFGEQFVVQLNTAGMDNKKDLLIEAILKTIPETQGILFRNDSPSRLQEGLSNYIEVGFGNPPKHIILEENETLFSASIWEGQKTGWFYDHRLNRTRMKDYVPNKRVLDVFSYLGAWGIQAAKLGAREIVCVDSSLQATQYIQQNADLNNVGNKIQIRCEDAFDALKKLNQEKNHFDVVILDPPAFAKKQKDIKEGLLAYQRINELALKLLNPEGILITCSCSMHISAADFIQTVRRASIHAQAPLQILERGHQAPDHPVHLAIPETDYLKMIIGRRFEG